MNCGLDLQKMFDFLADLNSRIQLDQDFVFSIYSSHESIFNWFMFPYFTL